MAICGLIFEEAGPDRVCTLDKDHGGPHDQELDGQIVDALRAKGREFAEALAAEDPEDSQWMAQDLASEIADAHDLVEVPDDDASDSEIQEALQRVVEVQAVFTKILLDAANEALK